MPETNETALEQTFADLAFTSLRDKAQALLDYLIGFQMLKNEDEGKRAVGIFGFEIDDKVYYAPVFFLNGEIRGLESLYSVDSDLFVPLTETWVNSIINKRQVEVGEPDTRGRNERGVRVPSYVRLKTLPSSHGSVNLKLAAEKMSSVRQYDGTIDLPTALREAGLARQFSQDLIKNAKLREAFERFYDMVDLTEASQEKQAAAAEKPVTLINSVTAEGVKDLSDAQREQIMAGGVAVIDKRPEVSKSVLYSTEAKRILENPTDGGLYDVLWADGSVSPAIVATSSDAMSSVFVLRLSDGKHCQISPRQVHVVRQYNRSEFANQLDTAGKVPSEVSPNDVVVFVSYDGNATAGYCIRSKNGGLSDSVVLVPHDVYYMRAEGSYHAAPIAYGQGPFAQRRGRVIPDERVARIIVGGFGSKEPIYTENKLVVNDKGFRAVVINKSSLTTEDSGYVKEIYSDKRPDAVLNLGDFGDYNTIQTQLEKTAQAIKVWKSTDGLFNVEDQRGVHTLSKTAAFKHVLINHGLGESDARLVVDTARGDAETYYVKYASSFDGFPQFPTDDSDATFGNEMNSLFPGQVPVSLRMPKTPEDNREFYMYNSPFAGGGHEGNGLSSTSPSALDSTVRASQTGQKEVFDASVMGSLLKSHNPTELVDRFLPTVITGMDRLGRILFLVFWHYDEFEERYGENDIAEMIDNLKASFNDVGEIVSFLKKRSLAGDPDHYGVGTGEANIEGDL